MICLQKLHFGDLLLLALSHWYCWVLKQWSSICNSFAWMSFEFTDHGLFLTVAYACKPTSTRLQFHLPRNWSSFVVQKTELLSAIYMSSAGNLSNETIGECQLMPPMCTQVLWEGRHFRKRDSCSRWFLWRCFSMHFLWPIKYLWTYTLCVRIELKCRFNHVIWASCYSVLRILCLLHRLTDASKLCAGAVYFR